MKRLILAIMAIASATLATAEEKLLVGHGPMVELIDARTLTTLASGTVGPGNTIGVAVSSDRRYGLVTEDSGGRLPNTPSLAVIDLTKANLPVVARLAPGLPVRRIVVVPGGKLAIAVARSSSLTSATVVFIDMQTTPPQVLTTLTTGLSGDFDVTPDGRTLYVTEPRTNVITVIDLTQNPPAPTGSFAAPPNLASIRVSPDGQRLFAMHQPNLTFLRARVWDLSTQNQPQQVADLQVQAEAAAAKPAYDPGNRFVVAAASPLLAPSYVMLFDTHATTPSVGYVLSAGAYLMHGIAVTRDGNRAFVSVTEWNLPASIREVNLQNPAQPAFTNRVMLRFFDAYELESFGEVHATGAVRRGQTHAINVSVPTHANQPYAMAASFGASPGIPAGSGRRIPLNPDALFAASRTLPSVFQSFNGTLDARGQATARIAVPAAAALSGVSLFVAAVVLDPSQPNGIGVVSNAERLRIR